MKKKESNRGKLIKTLVEDYLSEHIFTPVDALMDDLQRLLNTNLDFKVQISEIRNVDTLTTGDISFEDEVGTNRVVTFVVTANSGK